MSHKLRFVIIVAAFCAVSLALMGTFAWFSDSVTADANKIVSGSVEIELSEKMIKDGELIDFPEGGIDGVMPTQEVSKIVSVKNVGKSPAWVRIKAAAVIKTSEGAALETVLSNGEDVILVTPLEGWTLKDGYYYCETVLEPGKETGNFIESIVFNGKMPNEYANAIADLDIKVEAVQSSNNGDTVFEATGWPE